MHNEDIHVHVHIDSATEIKARLDHMAASLSGLHQRMDTLMATLADVQTAVTNEDTVIDSAITLLNGLAQQIKDLTPNQAAIDALAADVTSKTAALAAALTANTTVPPVAPTVPVVAPT